MFKIRFENWIASMLDVVSGLSSVLTFTYYRLDWDFTYRIYVAKKRVKDRMKNEIPSNS